jgi:hypothetical protein
MTSSEQARQDAMAAAEVAHEMLLAVAERVTSSRQLDGGAHDSDERVHADELLALAARELCHAVDALPPEDQPVGWNLGR